MTQKRQLSFLAFEDSFFFEISLVFFTYFIRNMGFDRGGRNFRGGNRGNRGGRGGGGRQFDAGPPDHVVGKVLLSDIQTMLIYRSRAFRARMREPFGL